MENTNKSNSLLTRFIEAYYYTPARVQHPCQCCHACRGRQHVGGQPVAACGDIQDGAADGTIVYFGKFYNGIDKEDSFVEHQLSIEIIEDVK